MPQDLAILAFRWGAWDTSRCSAMFLEKRLSGLAVQRVLRTAPWEPSIRCGGGERGAQVHQLRPDRACAARHLAVGDGAAQGRTGTDGGPARLGGGRAQGAPAPARPLRVLPSGRLAAHREHDGAPAIAGGDPGGHQPRAGAHHLARPAPRLRQLLRHARGPTQSHPELMGHATIEMTMRYAHLAPEARESVVQQLDRQVPLQFHTAPPTTPEGQTEGT